MGEKEVLEGTTEVQASLDLVGGERKFIVRNVGSVSARTVRFSVKAEREKNSPVSTHDIKSLFPVAELGPDEHVAVGAIITPGTGLHFRGVVTWQNPDGSEEERVYYMSA